MARLTDSNGLLLGGMDATPKGRRVPLSETKMAAILAPPAPPLPPVYSADEIVFQLKCGYGSFAYLTYSSAAKPVAENGVIPHPRDCQTLIEEAATRHFCPDCGGYYCAAHAEPASHDCQSVMRLH